MNIPPSGARLQANSRQPSVDLATLIEVLVPVVNHFADDGSTLAPDAENPRKRELIQFNARKRLRICTSGVLRRLFAAKKFRSAFQVDSSEPGSGFIQDFAPPRLGEIVRLGGRLTEGNENRLPKLLDRLSDEINRALDIGGVTDEALLSLLLADPKNHLAQLGKRLRATLPGQDGPQVATIQSVLFQSQPAQSSPAMKPVAKVISALEQIDARNYFDKLKGAIADYLEQEEDADEDELETALDSLQKEREGNDSQIGRFINFLENEALARVRLNITFGIMAEMATIARQHPVGNRGGLVNYVDTVLGVVELSQTESLAIDLSRYFGANCQFTLNDSLNQALFFGCLAVWPEAKAQIFEEKTIVNSGEVVQREVTYRFRINGQNPDTGKSAFESRLDRIQETLLNALDPKKSQTVKPHEINRNLAQLLFLDGVIPSSFPTAENPLVDFNAQQWLKKFRARLAWLSRDNGESIQSKIVTLISGLQDRKNLVSSLAMALMTLIRTQDDRLLSQIKQRSRRQFISVQRSIINLERLNSGNVNGLLQGKGSGEKTEWFKHLTIGDRPRSRNLFSVEVNTELSGHNLIFQETPPVTLQANREFSSQILQILWVPHEYEMSSASQLPKTTIDQDNSQNTQPKYKPTINTNLGQPWALDAAIQIEYEAKILQRSSKSKDSNLSPDEYESKAHYHAAGIVAFEVLTYVVLWQIIKRLKALSTDKFTALMVRLQNEADKQRDFTSGETYVYAAAQSIETVLNQDISLRMQGFVLENLQKSSYVNQGSFRALLSAFPLQLSTPTTPYLPKIGMITYATRPCDDCPQRESALNYLLLVSKSYTATAIQQPFSGYTIQSVSTDLDIVNLSDQTRHPRLIKEAIYQLQQQGCEHILLIAHSYGGRKLNRTASQTNFLIQSNFLEDLFQTFPELTLYPLVKDEFPATRLYKRSYTEAGFEINRTEHHANLWRSPNDTIAPSQRQTVRDLIPAYTFATLNVVGDENQRPQSGFCTYFLLSDQQVSNRAWTERARQHLLNADGSSPIHPGLISLLRGVHFLEAEKLDKRGILPVLNPYGWITPTTKEAAGDVAILSSRRRGDTLLSYPAILSHISSVLHR